jgi:hypothetical protein
LFSSPEKGCARTKAFKLGWSLLPDERLSFGGGSANSPFVAGRKGFEVGFMMEKVKKIFFLVFIKRKGYKYEDKLGSKKIATVP